MLVSRPKQASGLVMRGVTAGISAGGAGGVRGAGPAGETEWSTIGFDTSSPYTDGRGPLVAGQPENRRYRARYRDDDNPVGEWSDIVEVTAAA